MPVHVFSNPCDVKKIDDIAQNIISKLFMIQLMHLELHIMVLQFSITEYISCTSFHATKIFNSGEGGVFVFQKIKFSKKE